MIRHCDGKWLPSPYIARCLLPPRAFAGHRGGRLALGDPPPSSPRATGRSSYGSRQGFGQWARRCAPSGPHLSSTLTFCLLRHVQGITKLAKRVHGWLGGCHGLLLCPPGRFPWVRGRPVAGDPAGFMVEPSESEERRPVDQVRNEPGP
jgi:hypothetical protein